MPSRDAAQAAMREACAATLYGLDAVYRHDDPFDATLRSICAWAASLDRYEAATIDIFTGTDYLTLAGPAQPREVLDQVHAVIAGHPRRRFHTLRPTWGPTSTDDVPTTGGWAGATLFAWTGTVLGSLSLWSSEPVDHREATHGLLPLLARAAMQTLEDRRRVWNSRAVVPPGPRPVTTRDARRPPR